MTKAVDIVGKKFNRLTVVERVENNKHNKARFRCICDCGNEVICIGSEIKNGHTKSCGCFNKENIYKHGLHSTHEYQTYYDMLTRCNNPYNKYYDRYGGRGISVCDRWSDKENGFINFYEDMGKRPIGKYSLDRIDNEGDYESNNCKWSTDVEQARNTSTNRMITYKGESLCISAWAERLGISKTTIKGRLDKGWPIERIIETPKKAVNKYLYDGKHMTTTELSLLFGISKDTILNRLHSGWAIEQAVETPIRKQKNSKPSQ